VSNDVEDRKSQMRVIFNRLAPDYDAAGCFAYFGRRLVEEVGVKPGQHVLDVATGLGAVLFPAAERVGPTGTVVGIDLAERMVRDTDDEAKRRGISARAVVMDAEHLDFPTGTFDCVLCGFGLMFFPALDRALSEFRRVLKPGGRLGVSTWRVSQADDLRAVLDDMGIDGPGEPGWITEPNKLQELLERAAFSDARVIVDATVFRYSNLDQYWQNARGTGLRRRLDVLDVGQSARVRAALAKRVRPHQRSDGIYLEATALLAVAGR
jgi:ubiquinone/menaquinone biosynthesis C-methylase UbiE